MQGNVEPLRKILVNAGPSTPLHLELLTQEDFPLLARDTPLFCLLLKKVIKHGKLKEFADNVLQPLHDLQLEVPFSPELEDPLLQLLDGGSDVVNAQLFSRFRVASSLILLFSKKPTLEKEVAERLRANLKSGSLSVRWGCLEVFTNLIYTSNNKAICAPLLSFCLQVLSDPNLLKAAADEAPSPLSPAEHSFSFSPSPSPSSPSSPSLPSLPSPSSSSSTPRLLKRSFPDYLPPLQFEKSRLVASALQFLQNYSYCNEDWEDLAAAEDQLVEALEKCLGQLETTLRKNPYLIRPALLFLSNLTAWSPKSKEAIFQRLDPLLGLLRDPKASLLSLASLARAVADQKEKQELLASKWSPQALLHQLSPSMALKSSPKFKGSTHDDVPSLFESLGKACSHSVSAQSKLLREGALRFLDASLTDDVPSGAAEKAFAFLEALSPGIYRLFLEDSDGYDHLAHESILEKLSNRPVGEENPSLKLDFLSYFSRTEDLLRLSAPVLPSSAKGVFQDPFRASCLSFFLGLGMKEDVSKTYLQGKDPAFLAREGNLRILELFLASTTKQELAPEEQLSVINEQFSFPPSLSPALIDHYGPIPALLILASKDDGFLYSSFEPYRQDQWVASQGEAHSATKRVYVASRRKWNEIDDSCNNPRPGHPLYSLRMGAIEEDPSCEIYYHGTSIRSAEDILQNGIDLTRGARNSDFSSSPAFYLTKNFSFARNWAIDRDPNSVAVLAFRVSEGDLQPHEGRAFDSASQDWSNFILTRPQTRIPTFRRGDAEGHKWIIGPISSNLGRVRYRGETPRPHLIDQQLIFQLCVREEGLADRLWNNIEGVVVYGN